MLQVGATEVEEEEEGNWGKKHKGTQRIARLEMITSSRRCYRMTLRAISLVYFYMTNTSA
jgi:hypothetical protein